MHIKYFTPIIIIVASYIVYLLSYMHAVSLIVIVINSYHRLTLILMDAMITYLNIQLAICIQKHQEGVFGGFWN